MRISTHSSRNSQIQAPGEVSPRKTALKQEKSNTFSLSEVCLMITAIVIFSLVLTAQHAFAATNTTARALYSCGPCYTVQIWGGAHGADTRIALFTPLSGGDTSNDIMYESNIQQFVALITADGNYWVKVGIISDMLVNDTTYPFYLWEDKTY